MYDSTFGKGSATVATPTAPKPQPQAASVPSSMADVVAPLSPAARATFHNTDLELQPGVIGKGGISYPTFSSGYGASLKSDPFSGRPLLQTTGPKGGFSPTALPDRVATTFDPAKPQKLTAKMLTNGRMPLSVSAPIKKKMGGTYSDELDHAIALELSGSNLKSNLIIEPGIHGGLSAQHDQLENQIARDVVNGDKTGVSLEEGQRRLAAAKNRTLAEDGTTANPASVAPKYDSTFGKADFGAQPGAFSVPGPGGGFKKKTSGPLTFDVQDPAKIAFLAGNAPQPEGNLNPLEIARNLPLNIVRGATRGALAYGLDLTGQQGFQPGAQENRSTSMLSPEQEVALYGTEPITPIFGDKIQSGKIKTKDIPSVTVAALGLGADLVPYAGGEESLWKQLAKSTDKTFIEAALTKLGVSEKLLPAAIEQVTKEKTEEGVVQILRKVDLSMRAGGEKGLFVPIARQAGEAAPKGDFQLSADGSGNYKERPGAANYDSSFGKNTDAAVERPAGVSPETAKKVVDDFSGRGKDMINQEIDKMTHDTAFAETEMGNTGKGGVKGFIPELKSAFEDFVNQRSAAKVEGMLRSKLAARDFAEIDARGVKGIVEYQRSVASVDSKFSKIKDYFDAKFAEANKSGIYTNYKPDWSGSNYLPQLWNNTPEEVAAALGKRVGLKPSFTLESVVKDYEAGIEKGLTPKFSKISDLMGWYERRVNKAIADRKFFDFLAQHNYIQPANQAPEGWNGLGDNFPKARTTYEHGQYGTVEYAGDYKAPPNLAKAIRNYLESPETASSKIANAVTMAKGVVLASGVPGTGFNFHGYSILARTALAGDNPIAATAKAAYYYAFPAAAEKAFVENAERASFFARHGLTFSVEDHNIVQIAKETKPGMFKVGQDVFRKSAKVIAHYFSDPLFQKIIPTLKLNKAEEIFRSLVKSGYAEDAAAKIASEQTNNFFGGINLAALGRDKTTQDLFRMIVFAPDFQEGGLRIAGGIAKSLLNPRNPEYHAYRVFARNLLGAYIGMNIANKAITGHYAFQNDAGHKFDIAIGKDASGKIRYFRPFSSAVDFIRVPVDAATALAKGDMQTFFNLIRNRLSVPLGAGVTVATGKDALGNDIYDPTASVANNIVSGAVQIGGMIAPQPVMGTVQYFRGKLDLEQTVSQALGFPLRFAKNTEADNTISSLIYDQLPKYRTRVKDMINSGDSVGAEQVMAQYNKSLYDAAVKAYESRNLPVPAKAEIIKSLSQYWMRPPTKKSLNSRATNQGKSTFQKLSGTP